MKILVTGANGQVGFCLVNQLKNTDWDFLALTRQELDISDLKQVEKIIGDYQPDLIINAAAFTAVDKAESEIELAFEINACGPENLAKAANTIGAAIFHISTDYVFDGESEKAYLETDEPRPQGIYGKSKLEGELLVSNANPKHIILRTAWVFGEHGNNFVKTMIRLGRDRDQLGIVADQFGGPTYAGDIAKVLIELASQQELQKNIPWGTYHFSGEPHVSWYEFAKSIFSEVEQQAIYLKKSPVLNPITTKDYPTPAKRPANSRLNCNKIQKNFNVDMSDWKKALENIQSYS